MLVIRPTVRICRTSAHLCQLHVRTLARFSFHREFIMPGRQQPSRAWVGDDVASDSIFLECIVHGVVDPSTILACKVRGGGVELVGECHNCMECLCSLWRFRCPAHVFPCVFVSVCEPELLVWCHPSRGSQRVRRWRQGKKWQLLERRRVVDPARFVFECSAKCSQARRAVINGRREQQFLLCFAVAVIDSPRCVFCGVDPLAEYAE